MSNLTNSIGELGHLTRSMLEYVEDIKKFSVGDYLIKKSFKTDGWLPESVGEKQYAANRKYIVVDKDEYGIPFVQKVLYNNSLQKEVTYLCNTDPRWIRYEMDPDYLHHLLLNNVNKNFNPMEFYKT